MMDGEEKRENKISFVERINREAGRPTEDPKKHSKTFCQVFGQRNLN